MPTSDATVEQQNGVLELVELECHKKWYITNYFSNSVSGPNISKIDANGPFCPPNIYNDLMIRPPIEASWFATYTKGKNFNILFRLQLLHALIYTPF